MKARLAIPALFASLLAACGMGPADGSSVPGDAATDVLPDGPGEETPAPLDAVEGDEGRPDWIEHCIECDEDDQCDDGLYCTGVPLCDPDPTDLSGERRCCHPVLVECPSDDGCLVGRCSEEVGGCVYATLDGDGDGHPGVECGGADCDDAVYSVHPGARELCDGHDNDCDGAIDEDAWVASVDPIVLTGPGEAPFSAAVAGGDSSWGVAWISAGTGSSLEVGAVVPGATGPVAATTAVTTAGPPLEVDVVPWGTGFVVLWIQGSSGETTSVNGIFVEGDGSVPGDPVNVLNVPGTVADLDVAVTTTTGRIGLFFRSDIDWDYEIYFLDFEWAPTTPYHDDFLDRLTFSAGFSGRPSAVGMESGFAVAWEDDRDGNTEVYLAQLGGTGILAGPARRITFAPGDSQDVSLAASPSGFGLGWMDSRAGGYDMLFTCLDASGARVCPELSLASGVERAWYPSVSYDGIGDQYALAFAVQDGTMFQPSISAVAPSAVPPPTDLDPGNALGDESALVVDVGLADAAGFRGVVWISGDGSTESAVMFQQLVCEEE